MPDEIGRADILAPREKLDIVVPAHGHLDHTMRCIESIYQNTLSKFHLIICDDSETSITNNQDNPVDPIDVSNEYFSRLTQRYNNITYVKRSEPFISGNQFFNEAIKHMETPYLVTVMNSMRVQPEWERIAMKLMRENPKIGCVGFKCIFPDTAKIECAGIKIENGFMPCDLGRDEPAHYRTTIYEVEAIQWAFALVRREAVEGNLDENLFYGFKGWDDIDNCFVLRSKGWKIFYCGYGVGVHHPRATRGTNSADGFIKNRENARKFWKRWGFWNNYLESRTMDVADKISDQTKNNLKAVFMEYQMCQQIVQSSQSMLAARDQLLRQLTVQALKDELKVSPDEYALGFNPSTDVWDLKRKGSPENVDRVQAGSPNPVPPALPGAIQDAVATRKEAISKALKDRADAMQKAEEHYKKAEEQADHKFHAETTEALKAS